MADAKQDEVLSRDGNENHHRNRNEATAICGMRARRFLGEIGAPPRDLGSAFLGSTGSNTLKGTSGNDIFAGSGQGGTFVFAANFGNDVITDFGAGRRSSDVVQFSKSVFDDFAAVMAHASQHGQDVVIAAQEGNTLTLKNTSLSSLDKSDFHFA